MKRSIQRGLRRRKADPRAPLAFDKLERYSNSHDRLDESPARPVSLGAAGPGAQPRDHGAVRPRDRGAAAGAAFRGHHRAGHRPTGAAADRVVLRPLREQGRAAPGALPALPRQPRGRVRRQALPARLARPRVRPDARGDRRPPDRRVRRAALAHPRDGAVHPPAPRRAAEGRDPAAEEAVRGHRRDRAAAPEADPARGSGRGGAVRAVPGRVDDAGKAALRRGAARQGCAARRARAGAPWLPVRRGRAMKLVLLLLLAAGTAQAADFKSTPKALAGGIAADQGTLVVPENRAKPGSRRIEIGYVRFHARTKTPKAPLFFLQGGPGSRAVSTSDGTVRFWAPFLDVCDVVLIDQRGTNDSLLAWTWDGPPPMDFFVSAQAAGRHVDAMTRKAREVFARRGVDLAGYTTVESADDLDALRQVLGYGKISLLGFSYGTHLAEAYMRRHDDRLENVALFGTENLGETDKLPWTADVAFRRLALLARQDPGIAGKIPDLEALYDRVNAKLAKSPMPCPVPMPGGDTLQVPVGPFGLAFLLRADLGDATDLPVFPRLLWSIDQGDDRVLAWFVRKRAPAALFVHGMGTAMDEASGASAARTALISEEAKTSRFGEVVNFPAPFATERLTEADLGDAYRAPLVSDVRTLIVSGELDFNTPPFQGEELRWGLP